MASTVYWIQWSSIFACLSPLILSYKIFAVDSGVCNDTIYLEEGAKSAAILRLTSKDFYDFTPLSCIITFKAVKHGWSGLTGVLEEIDLRRYEDKADHHLAQSKCIDFIKVLHNNNNNQIPQDEQCGSWTLTGAGGLSNLGFRRSLFGYCPNAPEPGSGVRCGESELKIHVSVGQKDFSSLLRGKTWRSYKGFTFVVTAYRHSIGERGCPEGLQSCRKTDYHGFQHHCIHRSLWCDHHINCGQPKNDDELYCHNDEMLSGLVTVMVGPWVGVALLVVLVLAGVLYWRRSRPPPPPGPPQPQDHNSYAESYEVSSTMSSAHHMAIQVRVVCNSGHGIHTPRTSPWQTADLPPSYESLFPQGPPPPLKSTITTNTTTTSSAASFDISTTSLVSATIGSNANATSCPSAYYSNTTQTSSIVIPISAICNNLGTSAIASTSFSTTTNTITSVTPTVTNTTTSTTTIASVGAPPAALASISVTSVSLAGPPGDIRSDKVKDHIDSLNPSQDNVSSSSSRAPTPDTYPKSDNKDFQSHVAEATPPLVEPEDTNITPCNSAGETPASVDVQLPYTFQDAAQSITDTVGEIRDPLGMQLCDKVLLSSRSLSKVQVKETVPITDEGKHQEDRLSTSQKMNESGNHQRGMSDRPDSASTQRAKMSVRKKEPSSRSTRVEVDPYFQFNISSRDMDEEIAHNSEINIPYSQSTRVEVDPYLQFDISSSDLDEEIAHSSEVNVPLMVESEDDDDMKLERESEISQSLDKDDESLL